MNNLKLYLGFQAQFWVSPFFLFFIYLPLHRDDHEDLTLSWSRQGHPYRTSRGARCS